MKLNKFFMGLFAAAAFTACSNDAIDAPQNPVEGEEVTSRFMTVSIRNANPMGRADGDQKDGFEEGLSYENKVSKARFYFFDEKGEPYKVRYTGQNYFDCTEVIKKEETGMPNVEAKLEAVIVLTSTDPKENFKGIKAMVAIANHHLANLPEENLSLAQLKAIVGDYAVSNINTSSDDGQFLMTSSSFGATAKEGKTLDYGCEVEVIYDDHIKTSKEEAEASPVDLYIERVVAKVRVTATWDGMEQASVITVKYNDKDYPAIKLQNKKADNTVQDIMTSDNADEAEQIYLVLTGWNLSSVAQESYLFKKVNAAWDLGDWWNAPTLNRSYWAENPASVTTESLKIYYHEDATAKVGTKLTTVNGSVTTTKEYNGDAIYCLENAADADNNGIKNTYDPDATVRNRTVAYIAGKLVTVKDGIATPVDYAEWGGQKYTESTLAAAMFKPSENQLYVCKETITYKKDEAGNVMKDEDGKDIIERRDWAYDPITIKDVILVNGESANKAGATIESDRRYLSYIILKNDETVKGNHPGYDYVDEGEWLFLKSTEGEKDVYTAVSTEKANELLTSVPGAKVWRDGDVYYYTDLHHLNANDKDETKGGIGVVRNHIYEVILSSVFGLGTPVLTPRPGEDFKEYPIQPQKPEKDAYYLGARLNILSWRVVSNKVDLDW